MRVTNLLTIALLGSAFGAAQPCSLADARGTYLLKTWGWHDLGPTHPSLPNTMGPTYGLGTVTFDGAGQGSGRFTVTSGGVAQAFEYVDFRYTVSENCGGSASYRRKVVGTEALLGSEKLELRILDDGARIAALTTDSGGRGAILNSEFHRLSRGPRACHPSMLRGTYSMRYEGWINMQMVNPSQPAYFAPESGLGVFVLDPTGANRGSAAHVWGGVQVTTELVSGTFSVNADCTGVFEFVSQVRGSPNTFTSKGPFVLSGDGATISLLMANPPALQYYERVSIP